MTNETSIAAIIGRVLDAEGGVKDIGDGAGVTRFGQTPQWLAAFHLPTPTTRNEAALNYRAWLQITKLEQICDIDDMLPLVVIDYAVNSGHEKAIRALQAAIGARPDGVIGSGTRERLALADRTIAAALVLIDRNEFLGAINTAHPEKHARFTKGWARRLSPQFLHLVIEAKGDSHA